VNDEDITGAGERFSRRQLLRRGALGALALPWVSAVAAGCGSSSHQATRPLTGLFQAWVLQLYPQLAALGSPRPQIAAATREILARQATRDQASVDFYVGLTPFDDLVRLQRAKVLAPWNGVMPDSVASDIPEQVRRESSLGGDLYSWPFLLDVTVLGWNAELVERAGLDAGRGPQTWDELADMAGQVVDSGAAPYGVTFDPRPWRSLVPIAHSFSTDVYDEQGRFDYTSDAAASALAVMRRLRGLANPDVLDTLGSDEQVFAAGLSAYFVKYQNAHIRSAASWPDPGQLVLSRLPRPPDGAGKTVFWTTGIGLTRFGENRHAVGRYAKSITYSEPFWQHAIGGGRGAGGQLPVFTSLWREWRRKPPPWLAGWATGVYEQLAHAVPIPPTAAGAGEFNAAVVAELNRYLDGEEASARRALAQAAKSA
jgi:multiple sugar transport system substrate-binding protein